MGVFHKIVVFIGTAVILVTLLVAVTSRRRTSTPSYLKWFYLYPLLLLLTSFNTITIDVIRPSFIVYMPAIEKIIATLNFIFFALFFYLSQSDTHVKNLIGTIALVFLLFTAPVALFLSQEVLLHYYFRAYHNLGVLCFCLLYLYAMFNSSSEILLKYEPTFWITMGIFFYVSVTIPIFLSYYYLASNQYADLLRILFPLTNISIIIMNVFFIYGHLCIPQPRKISL